MKSRKLNTPEACDVLIETLDHLTSISKTITILTNKSLIVDAFRARMHGKLDSIDIAKLTKKVDDLCSQ